MNKYLCLLTTLFAASLAQAQDYTGKVYERGSNQAKVLYTYKRTEVTTGDTQKFRVQYLKEGSEPITEELTLKAGLPVSYAMKQPAVSESGSMEAVDGKLHLSYTHDGKTKTAEEDLTPDLVVGPSILVYLKAHWNDIVQGHDVPLRLAVLDRLETVGFKFIKMGESVKDGKTLVRVKMKPSSFLIAALVDPIYFMVNKENGKLVNTAGTTLVREVVKNKLTNLSAEMAFD